MLDNVEFSRKLSLLRQKADNYQIYNDLASPWHPEPIDSALNRIFDRVAEPSAHRADSGAKIPKSDREKINLLLQIVDA